MKKRKQSTNPNKSTGFGYVGRWNDGSIGWAMPGYLSGFSRRESKEEPNSEERPYIIGETGVLCKITVEVIKDKKGREIRRVFKKRD